MWEVDILMTSFSSCAGVKSSFFYPLKSDGRNNSGLHLFKWGKYFAHINCPWYRYQNVFQNSNKWILPWYTLREWVRTHVSWRESQCSWGGEQAEIQTRRAERNRNQMSWFLVLFFLKQNNPISRFLFLMNTLSLNILRRVSSQCVCECVYTCLCVWHCWCAFVKNSRLSGSSKNATGKKPTVSLIPWCLHLGRIFFFHPQIEYLRMENF